MIQRDSVRDRLTREQGISYTEFSYSLLQAWDFKHLAEHNEVTVQVGGSDQWGNIVSGVDVVRRVLQRTVYGLTCPLVTKADGGKFGKTEAGAVWLTADRTSPFALYQFFVNTADADVGRFLRLFTFLPLDEVARIEEAHRADPGQRGRVGPGRGGDRPNAGSRASGRRGGRGRGRACSRAMSAPSRSRPSWRPSRECRRPPILWPTSVRPRSRSRTCWSPPASVRASGRRVNSWPPARCHSTGCRPERLTRSPPSRSCMAG